MHTLSNSGFGNMFCKNVSSTEEPLAQHKCAVAEDVYAASHHRLHRFCWQLPARKQGARQHSLCGSQHWHAEQSERQQHNWSTKRLGTETKAECHQGTKTHGKESAQEAGETELCRRRLSS